MKTRLSKKTHGVETAAMPDSQGLSTKSITKVPGGISILNLADGPLDLNPNMPVRALFEAIAESTRNNVAIVLTARSCGEGHEVDFGILMLPPDLAFGTLTDFVETLETLADLGLETAVEDEE
jgi:hypothetical protein